MPKTRQEFDFVIIGSGFGGSVSAMRLSQKGYRVAVLEMGKRYRNADFPKTNWNLRKYLWAPLIRCFGIQKITLLKKIMLLHGVGVGGGSLVYANTLMRAEDKIFDNELWPKDIDWASELSSHYETAEKMLGVVKNPVLLQNEMAIKTLGEKLGCAESFHPTDVGVYFGKEGEKNVDPYFSGDGPVREACNSCGACMIGCPNGAKNTLDKNYLYFAEKWGAKVFPETKVKLIRSANDGYLVETKSSTALIKWKKTIFRAKRVIFSAGVLGSTELLLKNRDVYKTLPKISQELGSGVRTNGESLLGVTSFEKHRDLSKGIAIGAAIHPDEHTKIEGVRYPERSDFLRFITVPLTPNGNALTRPLKMCFHFILRIFRVLRLWTIWDWARSTVVLLVMQSIESKMKLRLGRSLFSGFKKKLKGGAEGDPIPSFLPIAQKSAEILAKEIKGEATNIASEVLLSTPATAHILGGASIGKDASSGVVDSNHEIFGYPGLYVCDGSVIPSNLAVNPSLTITAMAERFCSKFSRNTAAGTDFKEPQIRFS